MKRITILLTTLLTIAFAAGCRDEASLDGLESQTKEDGTSAGETAESKAVKEMLTYESDLEYNWVTEYAPAEGLSYTILFNFLSDGSVTSDSPVSENEQALALFTVSGLDEGGIASIKFDGATMLNDAIIDLAYRERRLIVESYDDNTVTCVGAESGTSFVLRKATSGDVLQLGEKLVWTALSGADAMKAIVRDANGRFVARYALERATKSIEFTWIDATTSDAKHERGTVEIETSESEYTLTWAPRLDQRKFVRVALLPHCRPECRAECRRHEARRTDRGKRRIRLHEHQAIQPRRTHGDRCGSPHAVGGACRG